VILAIYTALGAEIAVDDGDRRASAAGTAGALESMVGLIEQALSGARAGLSDISAVAVCTGPGSFTGLRIGVAFAKGFAQARDLPIVGVSSYDIAAFGIATYPHISVARGKPNYYYARVCATPQSAPVLMQGDRERIEAAAAGFSPPARVIGPDFTTQKPGDAALAVASLARQAFEREPRHGWTEVTIDYGQRPNAEVNWERRQADAAGGPEVLTREPST
jgi:tRNA threonylcarbamoyl adenosine modification protein YeaZ